MNPTSRPTVVVHHGADRPPPLTGVDLRATVRYATAETLADALPGADVLFAWDSRSTALARAWPAATSLRWVHAAGAAVNHLLFPALRESDVTVTHARGVFDEPMAEYVLGLMLAFAKDLPTTLRAQQRRRHQHRQTERLSGTRALVVGTSPIGRAIARKLRAVGVHTTGATRAARGPDQDFLDMVPMSALHQAVAAQDWVIITAALTPETRGLVDAAFLRAMRPTARLVTVSRAGLLVPEDVATALHRADIAGAALDVFADEPLPPTSPLWDAPNILISPHMSGDIKGWREELVRLFEDNLVRYIAGLPLVGQVHPS